MDDPNNNKKAAADEEEQADAAEIPAIAQSASFPEDTSRPSSVVVSKITGHRTDSGTMTIDEAKDTAARLRANTAPSDLQSSIRSSAAAGVVVEASAGANSATAAAAAAAAATEEPSSTANSTAAAAATTSNEDDDDEEIKLAMAMALAIQNNPNMTPDEIHELVGGGGGGGVAPAGTSQAPAPAPAASLLPKNLVTSMFDTNKDKDNKDRRKSGLAGFNVLREKAQHRFSEMESRVTLPFRSTTKQAAAMAVAEVEEEAEEQDTVVEKDKAKPTDEETTAAVEPAQKAAVSTKADVTTEKATATTTATVETSIDVPPPEELLTKAKQAVATAVDEMKDAKQAAVEVVGVVPEVASEMAKKASEKAEETMQKVEATASESKVKVIAATTSDKSLAVNNNSPKQQVRLTTIAWKRRGGMGKYSTTSAWERRRIALSGTKLMYYLADESTAEMSTSSTTDYEGGNDSIKDLIPSNRHGSTTTTGGGGGGGATSWFETVASSWPAAHINNTVGLEPDSNLSVNPRGYLDIAKEKATVNAAFGHSGAPTPFALSIKVKSETKWKLCFDRHSVCMEWLAAITDVVVQSSVDAYNAALLEAADPANVSDFALFHPPSSLNGPATRASSDSKKAYSLWMLEKYHVQSDNTFDDDDEAAQKTTAVVEQEEETMTETVYEVDELDHKAAQDAALEVATKTMILPRDHLVYAATVMNLALLLARASSTTVEGFWRIVVFGNLGVFLCLVEHPDWRSILERIRASPAAAAESSDPQLLLKSSIKKRTSAVISAKVSISGDKLTPSAKVEPSYKPNAGSSSVKLDEPTDTPKNDKGEMFAGWRTMPGETLMVRSHGYSETKKKVSSPGELYECVAVDVFESPTRYPDMGPRVKLPEVNFDDGDAPKTWRSPDIFIISIALPTDPPKMGRSSSDGGGYTVTMYYRMTQNTRDILRRVTADGYDPSTEKVDDKQKSRVNAVRLLEEWIRRSPSDPKFQARFKVVPNAHNLKEIGMPGWISKYNGKPFLIKRAGVTGFLHVHPELSCVEFDISLHPFPYLAKQGICFMKESYFKKVLVTFGFVIEGRADDELPECLIGLMQLCYPDPQFAIQAENFFDGSAPRSS